MTGEAQTGYGTDDRHISLDIGRYLLLCGVIALHLIGLISNSDLGLWSIMVRNLSNIAVPVYFMTAGYFLNWQSRGYRRLIVQPLLRLMPLYLFWLAIYLIHFELTAGGGWIWSLRDMLNGGPGYHLWFLPALLVALIVVAVANKAVGLWGTLLLCGSLAAVGLTRGALHDLLGMSGGAQRAGILMAPIFVWLGSAIRLFAPERIDWRVTAIAVLPALVMEGGENATFSYIAFGHVQIVHEFPVTMPFTAAAVFLAIRSIPAWVWPLWLVEQSRYTLGVYASHVLIIYSIGRSIPLTGPVSLLMVVIGVLFISSLIARGMMMIKPFRRFVM